MSQNFRNIVLADIEGMLCLHNALTHEKLFEERTHEVQGLAMNQYFPDMFCYTTPGTLNIKTGDLKVIRQKVDGVVVGFRSSTAFILQGQTLVSVDILQSMNIKRENVFISVFFV